MWGALAAASAGTLSSGLDFYSNHRNRQISKDVMNYEKWAQQQTWDREDSAHQRAVADLKAAGLSPVLAAGSASPTSAPIKPDVPKWEPLGNSVRAGVSTAMDIMSGLASLKQQQASITKTEAETDNIALQSAGLDLSNRLNTQTFPHKLRLALAEALYKEGSISKQDLERTVMQYDHDWSKNFGIRNRDTITGYSMLGSALTSGGKALSSALQLGGEKVSRMIEGMFSDERRKKARSDFQKMQDNYGI